ncbi:MAG: SPOR domain-containing protein [Spirochaetales bacterium]|nr:SPOR domain-containing protein [Spirochaetales bacterium]
MEQKKVIWILFAVAALLLVVVGAGFIWFLPERPGEEATAETEAQGYGSAAGFDAIEWVRSEEDIPGIEPAGDSTEPEEFIVSEELVYGSDEVIQPREGQGAVSEEDSDRAIRLVDPAPGSRAPIQQAAPRQPVQTAPVREPQKQLVTEYWIQAGSYSSNTKANAVREQLAVKGLTATIQTRELESGTYFRVRLGPYGNNEEAVKFLGWMKELDGFQDSYITEVYVRK